MFGFGVKQRVCTVCGYNTIGKRPDQCPFCGANPEKLMDSKRTQRLYKLKSIPVNEQVSQLRCSPVLGLDHAAYRIETDSGSVLIDCPAIFCADVEPVQAILFTHKDFIGAANEYRKAWDCDVCLHIADAELSEVSRHSVNQSFTENFDRCGVHAIHIGGHSPGFTVYVWQDILFICDYAYPGGPGMKLNPHGPREATREGAGRLADVIADHELSTVCGYNYIADFGSWQHEFLKLV
jgi:glyoxylase-like metal-dependent hydrolase (beta-lactamase superfamily II)